MVNGVAHSHKVAKNLWKVVLVVRKSIIACLPHSAALMHSVEYQFFIILAFNKALAFQALGLSRCLRASTPTPWEHCIEQNLLLIRVSG